MKVMETARNDHIDELTDRCMAALGRLDDAYRGIDPSSPVVEALRLDEALSSCAIEGIHAPLRSVVRGSNRPEVVLIRGCRGAALTDAPLTVTGIEDICSTLRCEDVRIRGPGQQVYVVNGFGEVVHTPPPGDDVGCLLEGLISAYEGSPRGLNEVAVFHPEFERIHPFSDGNGRTGRALLSIMLRSWTECPVPVSACILESRGEYYRQLRIFQDGRGPALWQDYLLRCIEAACAHAERALENISGDLESVTASLGSAHRSIRII